MILEELDRLSGDRGVQRSAFSPGNAVESAAYVTSVLQVPIRGAPLMMHAAQAFYVFPQRMLICYL
jgi:hypothetical protein